MEKQKQGKTIAAMPMCMIAKKRDCCLCKYRSTRSGTLRVSAPPFLLMAWRSERVRRVHVSGKSHVTCCRHVL